MKGENMTKQKPNKIKIRLAELGMNQTDLAKDVGITNGYLSRVIRGQQKCGDKTADAIAAKLGRTRRTLGL